MKKSKKILLVCISTIMLVVLFFSRESFAATVVLDGISKQYETWSNLSDDEKKNTVVPSLNSQVTSTIDLGKNEDVLPSKYITNNVNVKVGNSQSTYFTNGGIVRDMQDTNECWCFASTSAFSYNLLKNNLTSSFKLFSPRHMDYACSRYGFFGEINWEGYNRDVFTYGNYIMASAYLARGSGPVDEEEFPFENVPAVTNIYPWEMEIAPKYMVKNIDRYNSIYKKYTENGVSYYSDNRLVNELSVSEVNAIRNKIKESIVTNGSIMTYTYTPVRESDLDYYTENFRNFYLPTNPTDTEHVMNHGVLIVGWDDNYSKENFNSKHRPANDGAYICLNCYGTSFGNDGYYYISYDDFYVESDLFVISEVSSIDYDRIYQYDPLGSSVGLPLSDGHNNYTDLKIANVFTKSSDSSKVEKINQMSFFLFDDEEVEVLVNPYNDNLDSCLSQSIGTVSSGYHTVEFSEPIEVKGDKFAVGLRLKNSNGVCLPMEIDPNVFGIDAPAYKYSPFAHAG